MTLRSGRKVMIACAESSSACSSRSLPQNSSPPAMKLGAPKMPSRCASSVVGAQPAFDVVGLRARERGRAVMPERCDDLGDHGGIADIAAFGELARDRPRAKNPRPSLRQGRPARRARPAARRGNGSGRAERQPERGALPLAVAHHVAALGGIEIERRGVPALRLEDRPEQERPPAHRDARALRERRDAHRREVRIGRGEFVEEVDSGMPYRSGIRRGAQAFPLRGGVR